MPHLQNLQEAGGKENRNDNLLWPAPGKKQRENQRPENHIKNPSQGIIHPTRGRTCIEFAIESKRRNENQGNEGPSLSQEIIHGPHRVHREMLIVINDR